MRTADLIIYGLLVFGWLVFSLVAQLLRNRRQDAGQASAGDVRAPRVPPPDVLLDTDWGRAPQRPAPAVHPYMPPAAAPVQPPAYSPPPAPALARRRVQLPPLRAPRDLRKAIVLTAILGPCRARQPYQPPDAER